MCLHLLVKKNWISEKNARWKQYKKVSSHFTEDIAYPLQIALC
jgi:hypothetical protein